MNAVVPMVELRNQLAERGSEFANALPSHISPEHFQRATLTAIAMNQKLLDVDRRSLFTALMRCAQDGLLPDGRQAAMVVFKDRERGVIAQYMPMVAGIRKLVQQGGEITRFEQNVVYERDEFHYQLGDRPEILHRPAMGDRGAPILCYSVAQFRDGTISREVMTAEEIEKVRRVSRNADGGPWTQWWGEMARKTVAKRHAKVLPMSNDAAAAIERDNKDEFNLSGPGFSPLSPGPDRRPRLAEKLDALAPQPDPRGGAPAESPDFAPAKRKRGRPTKAEEAPQEVDPLTAADARMAAEDDVRGYDGPEPEDASGYKGREQGKQLELEDKITTGPQKSDFERGVADARAGRMACLDRAIREDPVRFDKWKAGWDSAHAV